MSDIHHTIIIATCGRNELLASALASVAAQMVKPDRLIVVDDRQPVDLEGLRSLGEKLGLTLEALANRRTKGASGSWNTALDHLARLEPNPDSHFVSFLDDDDWWDGHYLPHVQAAMRTGADVVAGSISRHDGISPRGRLYQPPRCLSADEALVRNPGIQGSNLTARLSTLLMAGLFDEALASCTDRDLCVRLADLAPAYRAATEAVAHHDTLHGLPRLSDKFGQAKRDGLDAFHAKWHWRMTEKQVRVSVKLARRRFGWSPSTYRPPVFDKSAQVEPPLATASEPMTLVVGIIVDGSAPDRCRPLLDGLRRFLQHRLVTSLDVVLLENGEAAGFQAVVDHGRRIGLAVWPVDLEAQFHAAPALPLREGDITRSKPIAIARTLLQRFVFQVSHARNYAPAWILDDDFRLPNNCDELATAMAACRESGIHVALGGNSGAAPVPASSLLRTQLVDLSHFLRCAARHDPDEAMPNADEANRRWLHERRDYHYDLTRDGTDRLETPFLPHFLGGTLRQAAGEAMRTAARILAGEAISRPVRPVPVIPPLSARDSCLRGGNTLILDTTLLRDLPNMSPRVGGRPTRRSDMIWAANAMHLFGRKVKSVPLPMTHDRSMERPDEDDTQRLIDDILGYGFFRAYEEMLRLESRRTGVSFTDDERDRVAANTGKYVEERLAAYRLSFWRSTGLARTLDNLVAEGPWWMEVAAPADLSAFNRFRDLLKRTTDPSQFIRVEDGVQVGLQTGEFTAFLAEIERIHPARDTSEVPFLRSWVKRGREEQVRALLLRRLGSAADALLGMGAEGVVLRLGERVVKVFDRWTAEQRREAAPVVAALRDQPTNGALPEVLVLHDWSEAFAVEYRFEESQPYLGGQGPELVTMLRDLGRSGWVHSNINPKNLRLTARGLQLIDIGKSMEPATPRGMEMMVRRAFLSWRFSFRKYLGTVMRASVGNEFLPELTGWRALLEAVESPPSKERLDLHIRRRAEILAPRLVLDYGCGKPRDASRWAEACQLTCFDVDPNLPGRWLRDAPNVQLWTEALLRAAVAERRHFDLIVCSMVLCAVDDTAMATILANIRRLIGEDGRILLAVCDPAAIHVTRAVDQTRHETKTLDALLPARYWKSVGDSPISRLESHRSIESYRRAFARTGLSIIAESTVNGFDAVHLERVPEFLIFELAPLPDLQVKTSLLVKLCALEAETALHQVRHLARQLGRPRAFDEVVLLVDPHEGPFPRAHGPGDLARLRQATDRLLAEGAVDRVVTGFADGAEAAACAHRWTGQSANRAHCANGQPATSVLAAFEECLGDYILHADADILIARPNPALDHIADAVRVLEENPDAVTLALSVNDDIDPTTRRGGPNGQPFRTESMAGWISKARLLALRPLSAGAKDGQLDLPWHRMLDVAVRQGRTASLRRGSSALWFAAPDNGRKSNVDDHLLLMDRIEAGFAPAIQRGKPLIQGPLVDWLGPKRTEPMVVVICGHNVRPGAIDRCMASLRAQSCGQWEAIVIDDASDDGSGEVLARSCRWLRGRARLVRRHRRVGLLANTFLAIRHLIASPDAVVVLLDLDDALADPRALAIIAEHHREGADLTVGSMLRTDKEVEYPVDFSNPRGNRGGNVWQHLRTFRKSLFDRIWLEDLKLDGQWVDLANDWAFMLPLVEMARNPIWIRETLYLHQPSSSRPPEERASREAIVARIVAKPSRRSRPLLEAPIGA
jgi:glycosyltransferase involved in cell wall biosynthesis/SAM-dependent methyltransferase